MRRILVADDDPHVGQAIRVWVKHHGFRFSTADGGPSGLAIRLFHERRPTVPLVAISGCALVDMETSAPEFLRLARLGAMRCLRKPFKPATLLAVINECLSEAEPHRRQVATLAAVTDAQARSKSSDVAAEMPVEVRHIGGRLPLCRPSPPSRPSPAGGATHRCWSSNSEGDQRAARLGNCRTIETECRAAPS